MKKAKIGIDPDFRKSGFALVLDGQLVELECLPFFDFFYQIDIVNEKTDLTVYIEASWLLKKSNWHGAKSFAHAAKKGHDVGMNHAVGRLFEQFCKYREIKHVLVTPNPKRPKLDAAQFERLTGWKGRTNQEKRDAAMLII